MPEYLAKWVVKCCWVASDESSQRDKREVKHEWSD